MVLSNPKDLMEWVFYYISYIDQWCTKNIDKDHIQIVLLYSWETSFIWVLFYIVKLFVKLQMKVLLKIWMYQAQYIEFLFVYVFYWDLVHFLELV